MNPRHLGYIVIYVVLVDKLHTLIVLLHARQDSMLFDERIGTLNNVIVAINFAICNSYLFVNIQYAGPQNFDMIRVKMEV